MATSGPQVVDTYVAAADLSAKQYFSVILDSSGQVAAHTSSVTPPLGILQNEPESGENARVCLSGVTKMILGETVDENDMVSPSATGSAVAAATGSYSMGMCTKGGAIDETGTINLNISYTVKA